jgi:hypothetical protein
MFVTPGICSPRQTKNRVAGEREKEYEPALPDRLASGVNGGAMVDDTPENFQTVTY